MNHAAGVLPNLEALDPSELKALIVEQHKQILIHHEQLLSRDTEIEHLKLLLAKLRRAQFGRSSEKVHRQIEQLELRLGELEQSRAIEAETRKPIAAEHVATRPVRRPLPAHLRREVQTYLQAKQVRYCRSCLDWWNPNETIKQFSDCSGVWRVRSVQFEAQFNRFQ